MFFFFCLYFIFWLGADGKWVKVDIFLLKQLLDHHLNASLEVRVRSDIQMKTTTQLACIQACSGYFVLCCLRSTIVTGSYESFECLPEMEFAMAT